MEARLVLLVALGGAIGAALRYIISNIIPAETMPYGTMTVNLVGSLLLGIMFGALAAGALISQDNLLLFGTGVLGAFTTMSTFALETIQLSQKAPSSAAMYVTLAIIGSLTFAWAGYRAGIALIS